MQRLLQVDDDLAFVGKHQGDHPAGALVVDVDVCTGLGFVIDAVTVRFHRLEQAFGVGHEFGVCHYNFTMLSTIRKVQSRSLMRAIFPAGGTVVLISAAIGTLIGTLTACGQQGALFLPTEPAAANRATLTETLGRGTRSTPVPAAPAAPAAPASSASSPSAPQ